MQFVVTYEDGETKTYRAKPRHFVIAEREGLKLTTDSIEASYRTAAIVAGVPAGEFDAWLETVDAIDFEAPEIIVEIPPITGE